MFSLTGDMIPRSIRRTFDQRSEERIVPSAEHAVLEYRGTRRPVDLLNLSPSGAMVGFAETPNIGERVRLEILDRKPVCGYVRWIRDGRIGLNFTAPL
ncbi:PilZ domain-containing protein [Sphingomonas sp. HDW15A]|uniref:PilZ domain-containing protein n=1 Tax=Sphingomonas sp. HDW15A TaxID=2714942 RepID=UPI003216CD60